MFFKIYSETESTWSINSSKLNSRFFFYMIVKACNFIKRRPQHRCFPVNIAKFLRLPILKNIYKRPFFYCFDGSLLHGPKVSRSRLYDGVRLQGPSPSSSFLFLSRHLSSWTESRPAFKNARRISLMSQLRFYIGYFWSF